MKRILMCAAMVSITAITLAERPLVNSKDDRAQRIQFESATQGRQSSWVDESAQPAAAEVPPADRAHQIIVDFSSSAPEVRCTVARLAADVLSPGGVGKVLTAMKRGDKTQLSAEQLRKYDDLVQQLRTQFKARYGEELDLRRNQLALNDYRVLRGAHSPDEAVAVAFRSNQDTEQPAQGSAGVKTQPERQVTLVLPPDADANQPALSATLSRESAAGAAWRLDVPEKLTAQKLDANLSRRLSKLLDGQSKWPADPKAAVRVITYQVIAAMMDQPADGPAEPPQQPGVENPSIES